MIKETQEDMSTGDLETLAETSGQGRKDFNAQRAEVEAFLAPTFGRPLPIANVRYL